MPSFTVHALPEDVADEARRSPGVVPAVAGDGPYPVRCCLRDADDASEVVLASIMPFRGESPYAAASPVYVHAERCEGHTAERDAVPEMLRDRILSVRAYDGSHMLTGTEVVRGTGLERRTRPPAGRRARRVRPRALRGPRLLRMPDRAGGDE